MMIDIEYHFRPRFRIVLQQHNTIETKVIALRCGFEVSTTVLRNL